MWCEAKVEAQRLLGHCVGHGETFEGLGTAGHHQTWQKSNLYCIHVLDPSMPDVLVLTQISCDEEVPPGHKARTQTWINVPVAQHVR